MRKISLNPSIFMVFSLFVLGACHGDPEQKASVCGNEVIENGEFCDGDQFGQASCVSEGFAAGALACTAACEIDTAGCIPVGCGDGAALDGEHCDGADLRGKTCEDRGFLGGGELACNADCTFNIDACVVGEPEDYTSGYPCEAGGVCYPDSQNPPFLPQVCAGYIEDARLLEPFFLCQFTCERHEDCPLGKACVERDGVRVCDDEPCDTPFEPCTLATGLPGLCTPVGDAMEELNLCRASGLRQLGEACEPDEEHEIQFAFQFAPETSCESGLCMATGITSSTCSETLCDALAVIEGRLDDPCPEGFNCLNLSHLTQLPEVPGAEISYIRTADIGACVPQEPSADRNSGRTCHLLTGLQTKGREPCPDGGHCWPSYWTGSLQGMCGEFREDPGLPEGAACNNDNPYCEAGTDCIWADPFITTEFNDTGRACRRICDATVYADNPACAGLPEGTTWVCLSMSRILTADHELPRVQDEYYDYVETHPSPLGFCVPDRI